MAKNLLRRNSWFLLFVADWLSSWSCDLVPTSEPSKPSFVLEPDILLDPDSVLDILDDVDHRSIGTDWYIFCFICQL